ncbi:hypothetical protein VM636_11435 [Streptomyces sp. SCSIO 75703]|uniref:hypothetical protein n=1 Tax=Streptomyces sp. SCSIO 75703 TaxID=3112165 RepID=UPI0030D49C46
MADEQDKWLDRETAEVVLRGEPLEKAGPEAEARARRLLDTLNALTTTDPELPGETAALAAFRAARAAPGTSLTRSADTPGAGAGAGVGVGTDGDAAVPAMRRADAPADTPGGASPLRGADTAAVAGGVPAVHGGDTPSGPRTDAPGGASAVRGADTACAPGSVPVVGGRDTPGPTCGDTPSGHRTGTTADTTRAARHDSAHGRRAEAAGAGSGGRPRVDVVADTPRAPSGVPREATAPAGRVGTGAAECSDAPSTPDVPPTSGEPGAASGDAGLVRLGTRAGRPRGSRWGRSVRFGLAAALSAGMVGGVAAGTGLLPTPFDGPSPDPAATVSAGATAERPLVSPSPSGAARDGSAPTGGATPGPDTTATGEDGDATGEPGTRTGDGATGDPGHQADLLRACREIRAGKGLDEARERALEQAAGGASHVGKYCANALAGPANGNNTRDRGDGRGAGSGWGQRSPGRDDDRDDDRQETGERNGAGNRGGDDSDGQGEEQQETDEEGDTGGGRPLASRLPPPPAPPALAPPRPLPEAPTHPAAPGARNTSGSGITARVEVAPGGGVTLSAGAAQ